MKRHFDDFCIQENASIVTHHLRIENYNSIGIIIIIWCDCDALNRLQLFECLNVGGKWKQSEVNRVTLKEKKRDAMEKKLIIIALF